MYPSDVLMQSLVRYLFVSCCIAVMRITFYTVKLVLGASELIVQSSLCTKDTLHLTKLVRAELRVFQKD